MSLVSNFLCFWNWSRNDRLPIWWMQYWNFTK